METSAEILKHYQMPDLLEKINRGLKQLGKSQSEITINDLSLVDEFHIRGSEATNELIEKLKPNKKMKVLDLGSGLGGAARRLASKSACQVTGVDLNQNYCRVGSVLNKMIDLEKRITLLHQNAGNLEIFGSETFDAAWTIHMSMNIENKLAMYQEVFRVLKQSSAFLIYDVLAADGPPEIHFPVPWATDKSASFLATEQEMILLLQEAGFQLEFSEDQSSLGVQFFEKNVVALRQLSGPPPLGIHLLLGPATENIISNISRNLQSGKTRLMLFSCVKNFQ